MRNPISQFFSFFLNLILCYQFIFFIPNTSFNTAEAQSCPAGQYMSSSLNRCVKTEDTLSNEATVRGQMNEAKDCEGKTGAEARTCYESLARSRIGEFNTQNGMEKYGTAVGVIQTVMLTFAMINFVALGNDAICARHYLFITGALVSALGEIVSHIKLRNDTKEVVKQYKAIEEATDGFDGQVRAYDFLIQEQQNISEHYKMKAWFLVGSTASYTLAMALAIADAIQIKAAIVASKATPTPTDDIQAEQNKKKGCVVGSLKGKKLASRGIRIAYATLAGAAQAYAWVGKGYSNCYAKPTPEEKYKCLGIDLDTASYDFDYKEQKRLRQYSLQQIENATSVDEVAFHFNSWAKASENYFSSQTVDDYQLFKSTSVHNQMGLNLTEVKKLFIQMIEMGQEFGNKFLENAGIPSALAQDGYQNILNNQAENQNINGTSNPNSGTPNEGGNGGTTPNTTTTLPEVVVSPAPTETNTNPTANEGAGGGGGSGNITNKLKELTPAAKNMFGNSGANGQNQNAQNGANGQNQNAQNGSGGDDVANQIGGENKGDTGWEDGDKTQNMVEKFWNNPITHAVMSGVMATLTGVLAGLSFKEADRAEDRAKAIEALKNKLQKYAGPGVNCSEKDRNDPGQNKLDCYCYTKDMLPNPERTKSMLCRRKWAWNNAPFAGIYDPKNPQNTLGCVNKGGDFDEKCKCVEKKECMMAPGSFNFGGLGLSSIGNNIGANTNSLFGGKLLTAQLATGGLASNAIAYKAARKLQDQYNADQKKSGQSTVNFKGLESQLAAKLLRHSPKALSSMSSSMASAGTSDLAKKDLDAIAQAAKEAGMDSDARYSSGGSDSKPQGESSEDLFGDLSGGNNAGTNEEISMDEAMNKNFNIGNADINNGGGSIFDMVTNRYRQSGLRRLFVDEKEAKKLESTPDNQTEKNKAP